MVSYRKKEEKIRPKSSWMDEICEVTEEMGLMEEELRDGETDDRKSLCNFKYLQEDVKTFLNV